ncbi:MAG: hypothetical protein KF864_04085 [Phycisphaeraceae bacterium]|nr:hypothetical protein [Phycisphaeraceae bacterium]
MTGRFWHAVMVVAGCALLLGGCARGARTSDVAVSADAYTDAFDAAKEVLREQGFALERIDAAKGVITTQPRHSAGLATPWKTDESSLGQEVEGLVNEQRRRAVVLFEPDQQAAQGQAGMICRVRVTVYRAQSPGWRVSSRTPTLPSVTTDPALSARGLGYGYETPRERDEALERRLAGTIARRIAAAGRQPAPGTPAPGPAATE